LRFACRHEQSPSLVRQALKRRNVDLVLLGILVELAGIEPATS
jgi:hypothetical protein